VAGLAPLAGRRRLGELPTGTASYSRPSRNASELSARTRHPGRDVCIAIRDLIPLMAVQIPDTR